MKEKKFPALDDFSLIAAILVVAVHTRSTDSEILWLVCNCVPNPSLVHCVGSGNGKVSWSDWPVGGKYGHPFSLGLSVQSFSVAAALVA